HRLERVGSPRWTASSQQLVWGPCVMIFHAAPATPASSSSERTRRTLSRCNFSFLLAFADGWLALLVESSRCFVLMGAFLPDCESNLLRLPHRAGLLIHPALQTGRLDGRCAFHLNRPDTCLAVLSG